MLSELPASETTLPAGLPGAGAAVPLQLARICPSRPARPLPDASLLVPSLSPADAEANMLSIPVSNG